VVSFAREAAEEIGVQLHTDELRLTGVVHCRTSEGQGRLGLFFATEHQPGRHGEPFNAEPDKCAKVAWFPLDMLPTNAVPYTTAGLDLFRGDEAFTALGWKAPPW
jgi:8-oxo-dGTP diphosphatase